MQFSRKIAPCLWFDNQAEEAAAFYTSIFKNSRIVKVSRYGEAGHEIHHRPAASVLTVVFELNGQPFTALNGGPVFEFKSVGRTTIVRCDRVAATMKNRSRFMGTRSMGLASEYKRQFGWRDWPAILAALPPLQDQTVLDLGCGVGDLAAEFVARGARVIGVDSNEELLAEARARRLSNAEFRMADLRTSARFEVAADGLWCSFAAAYFTDLSPMLAAWSANVKPGGWIALTEIDDLFGHEPLSAGTKALLAAYAEDALAAGRYDFHMGRKLKHHFETAGLVVSKIINVEDKELSFTGPASSDVLDAWRSRIDRMKLLHAFCGASFGRVREEFLECLMRADHESTARIYCCIARTRDVRT